MAKKEKENKTQNLINSAINSGIKAIIRDNPKFEGFEEYLIKHIDQDQIINLAYKISEDYQEHLKEKTISSEEVSKIIYSVLTKYIAAGHGLDERGKKIILKNSLEGKVEEKQGFFRRLFKKKELNNESYLNNALSAFGDLYSLMKSGKYEEKMPELEKSLSTLDDLKFLDPATDILKEYGFIDDKKYKELKKGIYTKAKDQSKYIIKHIEDYVIPQKIAAGVIGLIGTFLLIFNLKITGQVIGGESTLTTGIIGVFMIFFSLLWYLRPLKKSFKK